MKMRLVALLAAGLLFGGAAQAQVHQFAEVVPGHCANWVANNQIEDAGAACNTGGGGGGSPGGTNGQIQFNNAGAFGGITAVLPANGGTGDVSPLSHSVMIAEGASPMNAVAGGTNCLLLWATIVADPTCATVLPGNYSFTGSPTFSNPLALGSSTATTQAQGTANTTLATTAYADRTFSATEPGAVPLSGGGTSNFLRADGAWAVPTGGGGGGVSITAGNTGIVVSPSPLTGTGTISLGNPSATTLGGIESIAATAHEWINSISTGGVPSLMQPAFTDLTGSLALTQIAAVNSNTIIANPTAASLAPQAQAVPSCSAASDALIWTSNTGIGCNTAITASAVPFTGVTGTATLAQLPPLAAFNSYCNNSASTAAPYDCLAPVLHSSDPTFGAAGNGTTDDTTALQAWITACGAQSIICVLDKPSSCYKITAALVVSVSGESIIGASKNGSKICPSNTTQDGIQVTASQVRLVNFSIIPSVAETAGSCVHIGTSATVNLTIIDGVNGSGFNCFNFIFEDQSILFNITNVSAAGSQYAIVTAFGGDSSIAENSSLNGEIAAIAFLSSSSGGLRIINNKINTAVGTGEGILINAAAGNTADVLISGNSIEGNYPTSIAFTKGSGTAFASAQIIGNEFSSVNSCITTDSNAGWLQQLQINGNLCSWSEGSSTTGMIIGSAPAGFQILDNQFNGEGGSGLAISVASGAVNGLVSNNQVVGTSASPAITNASTTTNTLTWAGGFLSTNNNIAVTGTTTPTAAVGQVTLSGLSAMPTFNGNGEGAMDVTTLGGFQLGGQGSTNDFAMRNKNATTVLSIPTGSSHLVTVQPTAPTVSACGTGTPTVTTGSTDVRGSVTTGTAATSCTITFNLAWSIAPFCVVSANSAVAIGGGAPSTTAFTTTMAALSGGVITWICLG